jgi:hypothetical protein
MLRTLAAFLLLVTTPALAQVSPAELIASRTGEVIGAASACGISDERLIRVGEVVIGMARQAARSPEELSRAADQ